MGWWLKWFVIGSLVAWFGYYRHQISQLSRTHTAGLSRIATSLANNTDSYQFFNRSEQMNNSYFECENIVYAHGICGNLQVPPIQRPCTPPLHIHLEQTEFFTLIQGHLAYQLGDKVYSCDIHTCPRPLIVPPLLSHTFWMHDNKEDLIVRVHAEPADKYNGLSQRFFENFAGINRDQHISIWQIFVLFENAQTYPASLPLPFMKIIVKLGALIGQLLGYKIEYEEYTTVEDNFN
ncbi:unnamed protein product [Rotaria sordida]|uniref:Cupin 2 conserved barrel domain-containing protein n=1 Tax=Rotaria sordida TaxID=392033 RepID=A0A814BSL1_9BILA|nr:unnamed protein product [Rotaria sordida]CAF1278707.1 unnamed protein product [Rotaria sordida]